MIDRLIAERLSVLEGVVLTGVGTLSVERVPAREVTKGHFTAPGFRLRFRAEEENAYPSVVDLMTMEKGSREQAEAEYRTWLERARKNGELHIAGVGVISNDRFSPDVALCEQLDPERGAEVRLRPRRRFRGLVAVGIVLAGCAGAALWYYAFGRPDDVIVAVRNLEPSPHGRAGVGGLSEEVPASEEVIAGELVRQAETRSAEKASDPAARQEPATLSETNVSTTGAPAVAGPYYVVVGVFSNEANADRLIALSPIEGEGIVYEKLPFRGGKTLVGIYPSATREQAQARVRELHATHPDLWVYERPE